MATRITVVDQERPDPRAMEAAGAVVQSGGLVAFPTESFYGLAADPLHPHAIARVLEVKGRPEQKPLLVLVDSVAMAESLVTAIPAGPRALMARYWPGALTTLPAAAPRAPP